MTSVTLAAPLLRDLGRVPGFPADALGGQSVFCLADTTVRQWVNGRRDEGTPVLIADPGWIPDAETGPRTLTFPADERDLAIIAHARAVWDMTHSRDAEGQWHERPRLDWQPISPGWHAIGDRHGYLVHRGPDDRGKLTRWNIHGDGSATLDFARELLDNTVAVDSPAEGQAIAQAYEDGRSIHGMPAWRRPAGKPPYVRRLSDLQAALNWDATELT